MSVDGPRNCAARIPAASARIGLQDLVEPRSLDLTGGVTAMQHNREDGRLVRIGNRHGTVIAGALLDD
jgi:hypothetical protein